MNNDRMQKLAELQEKLSYVFRDATLLSTALTHRSYVNENPQSGGEDNERLEFLGDAVLGLCVSDLLMKKHPDFDEGTLSKIRSALVNEKPLADLALQLGLGDCLLLGRGEEHSGGRAKESLLANALEAVIAAIYLDSSFSKTKTLLRRLMKPMMKDEAIAAQSPDYKTALQELCQKKYKTAPIYTLLAESGPEHEKIFEMEVVIGDDIRKIGCGRSKKEAQKQAAQKAWESLHRENGA
ncbi:MAG: ribonuclease III [Smithellaceae bacterium]|jgi:ribonuclease III|nr:ribonuclease III [Smithellaceae bacterium]MDD3259711.1 ribonuclease III [Smithellaceae bacterium]MDD3849376.1 ribonuclease III [Smithellaceae bacterium]